MSFQYLFCRPPAHVLLHVNAAQTISSFMTNLQMLSDICCFDHLTIFFSDQHGTDRVFRCRGEASPSLQWPVTDGGSDARDGGSDGSDDDGNSASVN